MRKMTIPKGFTLQQILPWVLIIGGIIGLLCSFTLTVDKMEFLRNPSFKPICDLNPVLSCGSVMKSKQADAFGFDNTFLGLAAFAALLTTGMTLVAGARLKRWYWLGLQAGVTGGVLFVHWLIFNSLYVLRTLCPFCMVVWVITITTFWYITLYNLREKHLTLKRGTWLSIANFADKHHLDILILWFLVIIGLILKQFWYYYGPLLGF